MVKRIITDVRIVDIQKRKVPSKHYVYVVSVTWSDSSVNVVYRRYSKFFDLQTKLIEEFPIEGGVTNPSARVLPFLPGKIIFGRSHVRDVAEKRKEPIHEYCAKLIALEPKISQCDLVLNFFEPKPEDIDLPTEKKKEKKKETADVISDPISLEQYVAIADYKKTNRNEVNMVAGDVVEVIDKNENGWWFVNVDEEQGWVPAAYLESAEGQTEELMCIDVTSIEGNQYITCQAHKAELDDEVGFEKGVIVTVLKKNFDGWWLISYLNKEGWAPSMYLKKPEPMQLRLAEISGGVSKIEMPKPVMQQRTSSTGAAFKGKKGIPPRKASVKRSIEKPNISLFNQSYEKSFEPVKEVDLVRPEAEYFTLNEFRAIGIQSGLDFDKGESIQVFDKSPNGWWFGKIGDHEGWIPSSYIGKREKSYKGVSASGRSQRPEPPSAQSKPEKAGLKDDLAMALGSITLKKTHETSHNHYVAIASFEDHTEGVISLREGDVMEVIDQSEGEWWLVKLNGKEGWAPSTYLKVYDEPQETHSKPPKPEVGAKPKPPQRPTHKYDKPAFPPVKLASKEDKKPYDKPSFPPVKLVSKEDKKPYDKPAFPPVKQVVKEDKKPVNPVPPKKIGKLDTTMFESKIPLMPPQHQNDNLRPHRTQSNSVSPSKTSANRLSSVDYSTEGKKLARRDPPPPPNAKQTCSKPVKPDPPKPAKRDPKPPRPAPPKKTAVPPKQMYIALATFADDDHASVSFQEGEMMEVLEQNDGGWWYVKTSNDECGWAPSNFLCPSS